ncbi:Get3/ArsA fold putative tail anchor-mediating ATPase NosAFP [Prochlorothrix hollandica]|uniref:ABC transporter ATPase n=1 Tax=Prochlorothrix hollandica PCC 9006 = CALU 1027 TaxID=317619 RepID=A0A0M2PUQ6_PROHO|nr:ArsA family ATPase [Prochlorothrix hollandica]KKI98121.1 ABC transporter ATPase [Prochlorothrix hollandica PCC 9006 = CALU 1027]
MTLILTLLGKGGTGCTTLAIAAAKAYAEQGKAVLLLSQDSSPALGLMLGCELGVEPQQLSSNLWVQSLKTTHLLEKSWEQLKEMEQQYLRSPFFRSVYGQELGVLPGMDRALALNYLRELSQSQTYDVILYDGLASQDTLRMLAMPDILGWYTRRFRQVFGDSDLGKTLLPFVQPVASAVLAVNWSDETLSEPTQKANNLLEQGRDAVADPSQVLAYLVTTAEPIAQATAHYLWGAAQQVGLTVGGVLVNQGHDAAALGDRFAPLPLSVIPAVSGEGLVNHWSTLQQALPEFCADPSVPRSLTVDEALNQIKLFLPGFDKKQVKLTQYGPEITIEAGDQRRNIFLPPSLAGQAVTGAKFADSHLILSFA